MNERIKGWLTYPYCRNPLRINYFKEDEMLPGRRVEYKGKKRNANNTNSRLIPRETARLPR